MKNNCTNVTEVDYNGYCDADSIESNKNFNVYNYTQSKSYYVLGICDDASIYQCDNNGNLIEYWYYWDVNCTQNYSYAFNVSERCYINSDYLSIRYISGCDTGDDDDDDDDINMSSTTTTETEIETPMTTDGSGSAGGGDDDAGVRFGNELIGYPLCCILIVFAYPSFS